MFPFHLHINCLEIKNFCSLVPLEDDKHSIFSPSAIYAEKFFSELIGL